MCKHPARRQYANIVRDVQPDGDWIIFVGCMDCGKLLINGLPYGKGRRIRKTATGDFRGGWEA